MSLFGLVCSHSTISGALCSLVRVWSPLIHCMHWGPPLHCNMFTLFYGLYSMIVSYAIFPMHHIQCIVFYALLSMHCIIYIAYSMHCFHCSAFFASFLNPQSTEAGIFWRICTQFLAESGNSQQFSFFSSIKFFFWGGGIIFPKLF